MKSRTLLIPVALLFATASRSQDIDASRKPLRVAACQAKRRVIDFRLKPEEALAAVDRNLDELEQIVHRAGKEKCDALAFPEDTLGLLNWLGRNEAAAKRVLPEAVKRMLERLGRAAASHRMYLVASSDAVEADGGIYNTAFFLGRDGRELGRYHKVCPTWAESGSRKRGRAFPVFPTPDLGNVGLAICYDLVMPETARCLALAGADVIFFPTMGTAAIGEGDIGLQALRVRAVENFVWLIVAHRGQGAMVISPQGKIIEEASGPDGLAIADIDPHGGREGGDSSNWQKDMRARLFRERNPDAFGLLTDPNPPVLGKIPLDLSREEAADIMARMLTVGEEEFQAADALVRQGKTSDAIEAFERLRTDYRDSWIDRVSVERLKKLGAVPRPNPGEAPREQGIAAEYPGDGGIEKDSRVLFAETFEDGTVADVVKRWSEASNKDGQVMALTSDAPPGSPGKRVLRMTATLGKDTGGHLYKHFVRGVDTMHARFYVKFAEDTGYIHHFTALGGYNPPTPWPQGGAGERPRGDDRIYIGIEPHGQYGRIPPPGAWSFYNYWHEMKVSAGGKYWGNAIGPEAPLVAPKGRWQCVEVKAKLNSTASKADGELTLWLDGVQVLHIAQGTRRGPWSGMGFKLPVQGGEPFEGFRWRSNDELRLNFFWLLHYVTENAARQNRVADPQRTTTVWFDHVVVATEYIGPIGTK